MRRVGPVVMSPLALVMSPSATLSPPPAQTAPLVEPSAVAVESTDPVAIALRWGRENLAAWLVPFVAVLTLLPWISGGVALLAGIAIALVWGNPYKASTRKLSRNLLQLSVIGLGAAMNLGVVARVGAAGIGYTVVGIGLTVLVGAWLGRRMQVERDVSLLVTAGTAICGGSAIAAVAPTIRARPHDISVALSVVFALNALALFIFPPIGHALGLTERQFGLWAALAIHDTSSVVGAASAFGKGALEIATTVKLARALWIVPLTFLVAFLYHHQRAALTAADSELPEASRGNPGVGAQQYPWFILGFLAMAAFFTLFPVLHSVGGVIAGLARQVLVLTLFLIGLGLDRAALQQTGLRPLLHGVALWFCAGIGTLLAILAHWIS